MKANLAILNVSARMQYDLIGDNLNLAWLENMLEVEFRVLCQCSKSPASQSSSFTSELLAITYQTVCQSWLDRILQTPLLLVCQVGYSDLDLGYIA